MALIFISYRREDTIALTGRIYDRLRAWILDATSTITSIGSWMPSKPW